MERGWRELEMYHQQALPPLEGGSLSLSERPPHTGGDAAQPPVQPPVQPTTTHAQPRVQQSQPLGQSTSEGAEHGEPHDSGGGNSGGGTAGGGSLRVEGPAGANAHRKRAREDATGAPKGGEGLKRRKWPHVVLRMRYPKRFNMSDIPKWGGEGGRAGRGGRGARGGRGGRGARGARGARSGTSGAAENGAAEKGAAENRSDGGNREKTKGDGGYITEELTWVQCDRCSKWRVVSGDDLPESWYCEMNADKAFASCNVAEQE